MDLAQTTVASWLLKSEKGADGAPTPLSRVSSLLLGDLLFTRPGRVSDGLTPSRRGEGNLEELVAVVWDAADAGDGGDLCSFLSHCTLSEIT